MFHDQAVLAFGSGLDANATHLMTAKPLSVPNPSKNFSSVLRSAPSASTLIPRRGSWGSSTTNSNPTPSLPHRTALACTAIDRSGLSSASPLFCRVMTRRVPGYHRSLVSRYRPLELISRTLCSSGEPPFQKCAANSGDGCRTALRCSFENNCSQICFSDFMPRRPSNPEKLLCPAGEIGRARPQALLHLLGHTDH